jgi:hypothetical protein
LVTVYVYYKVPAADEQAAAQALLGLGCVVSRRADERDGLVTLMERYQLTEAPSPAWLKQMHRSAEAALGAIAQSERRCEVFVDLKTAD